MTTSLCQYLNENNVYIMEGHCQNCPEKVETLISIIKRYSSGECEGIKIKSILEIGFNAGHSTELFLDNNPDVNVVSFDIGVYDYTNIGKKYIDNKYPFRHSLVIGDSQMTIPEYHKKFPNKKFDLIYIDGGHEYDICKNDLMNCYQMAHENTILIMDDIMYKNEWDKFWTSGPTKVWVETLEKGITFELQSFSFGEGLGMAFGKYIIMPFL